MKLTIHVCNVCKDPSRPVTSFSFAQGSVEDIISRKVQVETIDLCDEHVAMIKGEEDEDYGPSYEPTPKPEPVQLRPRETPSRAGRGGNRPRITSMEEIAARRQR